MTNSDDLLRIYLRDHDAAATAGMSLARRCARSNRDNELGTYLRGQFIPELETDHALVQSVLALKEASPSRVKQLLAQAGSLLGQAKLNGAIVSYSPLSRVLELEALIAGVHAKQRLWAALRALAEPDESRLADVTAALNRAESQLAELERHHIAATAIAFDADLKGNER